MAVNSNYVLARNKKTGVEVEMPPKTFEILRKQYDLVSGEVQESTQKKTVKGAEVVAPEIQVRKQVLSPEDIAAKKAELQAMNEQAVKNAEKSKQFNEEMEEIKKDPTKKLPMNHPAVRAHLNRNKRGPKPKQKNAEV